MKRTKCGLLEESGFTLVELLVVIVIISILAAIAIPVFFRQRDKALVSQVTSGLRDGATIMQAWATGNNGSYEVPQGEAAGATADMAWMDGEDWPPTEGVIIDIAIASQGAFCLSGTHETQPAIQLEYSSGVGAPVEGDCS